VAADAKRQAEARQHRRRISSRLSEQGFGLQSNDPPSADAHRRDRRLFRTEGRRKPDGAKEAARLREKLLAGRLGGRTRQQVELQQLRLFTAGNDRSESERKGLLRVRARKCL